MKLRWAKLVAWAVGLGAGLLILSSSSIAWEQASRAGLREVLEFGLAIGLSAVGGAVLCGGVVFHFLEATCIER